MKSPHEILVEIEDFVSMKLNEVRQWLSEIGHPPPEPDPPSQPDVDNGGDNPPPTPAPKPAPDYPDQESPTVGNDPTGGSRADMP